MCQYLSSDMHRPIHENRHRIHINERDAVFLDTRLCLALPSYKVDNWKKVLAESLYSTAGNTL